MKKLLFIALLFVSNLIYCQNSGKEIFQRITTETGKFTVDTSAVPKDKLTEAIRKLRSIKGGFNINEGILYKIAEDKNKGEITAAEAEKFEAFFTKGNGQKWLENAVVWIYRNQFSLDEINELVRFYSSPAGKKLSQNFPIIMIESMQSAEEIIKKYKSEIHK